MKKIILTLALIVGYMTCTAQQTINCLSTNCFLASNDINNDELNNALQADAIKQKNQIKYLCEQAFTMKSFISSYTDFNTLTYSLSDAIDMGYEQKSVIEYYIDPKAQDAAIVIINDANQIVREYPLDLGMKTLLLVNKKKLHDARYTYKLFINGVDVCYRNL